jgi:hypothetical protein
VGLAISVTGGNWVRDKDLQDETGLMPKKKRLNVGLSHWAIIEIT